uniref:Uncharacterized protein n=1 Tax=Anopheles atroparvus TaxID=41427 RepID=A0A182JL54_ANOAO
MARPGNKVSCFRAAPGTADCFRLSVQPPQGRRLGDAAAARAIAAVYECTQTSFAPSSVAASATTAPPSALSSVLFSLFSSSSTTASVASVASSPVVPPFLCSTSGTAGAASFRNTSRLSTSLAMSKSS